MKLHIFFCFIAALSTFTQGCSLKAEKEGSGVTVAIPGAGAWSGGGRIGGPSGEGFQWNGPPPNTLSGFSCFFINIAGSGIPLARDALNSQQCFAPNMPPMSVVGGMVPVSSGGSVTLSVPPGPGRTIQILALQSTIGCPSMEQVLSGAVNRTEFGEVFEVGRVSTDINGPTSVQVPVSWDVNNPKRYFCQNGVNLAVPIEMVDRQLFSSVGAVTFERTRTSLNTSDYDGYTSYYFELIAYNSDAGARDVYLVDSSGATRGTFTLPVTGATPTRFAAALWTPNTGADTYRIQTSAGNNVFIYNARIIVVQRNATRTKVYIPLIAYTNGGYTNSDVCSGGEVDSHAYLNSAIGQGQNKYYSVWQHNAGAFVGDATGSEWSLEAVLGNTTSETAYAALYDDTGAALVAGSQISVATAAATPALASGSFSDSLLTSGHQYQLRFWGTSGATHCLFRAGLWRKITNLQAGEVAFRISPHMNVSPGTTENTYTRVLLNLSHFSSPDLYHEATLTTAGGSTGLVRFMTAGTNESGSSISEVTSAQLSFPTPSTKMLARSPNITAVADGDRFVTAVTATGTAVEMTQSFMVIRFHK